MKTISVSDAANDLQQLLESAQEERVVITRNGRPSAVVLGIESYDDEDLRLAGSPSFWKMIEKRRAGSSISLAEAKKLLAEDE